MRNFAGNPLSSVLNEADSADPADGTAGTADVKTGAYQGRKKLAVKNQ
jgi:hypothetical protein